MWQLLTGSWRFWWLPALVQGLLSMAHQAWLLHTMPPLPKDLSPLVALPAVSAFASSGAFWFPLLALLLASMLPFITLVLLFERLQEGKSVSGASALRAALPLWPGAMLAGLCYLLLVVAGTLLFLVPGAWLGGRWLLWPVALVRDGGGLGSLERGAALLRGRWWRVNGWVTAVFLVAGLAALALDALLGWLPGPMVACLSAALTAPALPLALVLAARGKEFA